MKNKKIKLYDEWKKGCPSPCEGFFKKKMGRAQNITQAITSKKRKRILNCLDFILTNVFRMFRSCMIEVGKINYFKGKYCCFYYIYLRLYL